MAPCTPFTASVSSAGKYAFVCSSCRELRKRQGLQSSTAIKQARLLTLVRAEQQGGREQWDFGRFVKTVTYFNKPPTPEEVLKTLVEQPAKLVRQLTGTEEEKRSVIQNLMSSDSALSDSQSRDVCLVAGATGGVGKRVVDVLLQQGRAVRALVRDEQKGKSLLGSLQAASGGSLELVVADITRPASLQQDMFANVRSVICCTAVRVSPKEGDTANRDKYKQGIKFYEPEVVGDTPEAVEFRGMQNLLASAQEHLGFRDGKQIFSAGGQSLANIWGPLDDVVMGGVSESGFQVRAGSGEQGQPAGIFSGNVSSSNNGGFASVRTKNFEPSLDLGAYGGLGLRVKGDGLRYKCTVRTDTNWDGIGYTLDCGHWNQFMGDHYTLVPKGWSFDTMAGEWQDIHLPFKDFVPLFRAKKVKDATLDPSTVTSIQLMLSKFEYDGKLNPSFKTGQFELPLSRIWGYAKQPQAPRFVLVSSAGVTRPGRPGIDLSKEPPAVRMNEELGGILTYKLKGEDVVRQSGVPFVVVRPCALTEEPAGAELQLSQGDTIKGKISRQDVAELCVKLLSLPEALDTTFEIKSTVPFSQPYEADANSTPRNWQAVVEDANLQKGVDGKMSVSEKPPALQTV